MRAPDESVRSRVGDFLRRNRMHYLDISMEKTCGAFLDEMRKGLEGAASSLAMIPTWLETDQAAPAGRAAIALDAGGTNLRVSIVRFDKEGAPAIEALQRHPMPGVEAEIGKEEFFRAMAGCILPIAGMSDRIGFCFSYPAEMQPDKDGRLIRFTKDIKARGVEGQLIGRNLALSLSSMGNTPPSRVVLLNDTVAALLAGRNAIPGRRFGGFIGFVCGTGMNAAYVESNASIGKVPNLNPKGSQVINMEAGSFDRGPIGKLDLLYFATTSDPPKGRYEKMVSGLYLGNLCLFVARAAAREGVLSPEAGRRLEGLASLSTREVSDFLLFPVDDANHLGRIAKGLADPAAAELFRLVDALVERAALLAAALLCAAVLKSGIGKDPRFPVLITADGTTFWQLRSFRARVESYMHSFLRGDRERAWEIIGVDDAPLLGAAIAALTN